MVLKYPNDVNVKMLDFATSGNELLEVVQVKFKDQLIRFCVMKNGEQIRAYHVDEEESQ